MTNENRSAPGTGLLPCFALSVEALDGVIRRMGGLATSDGASLRDVEACLLTIRANAAGDTPGLNSTLDAVRSSIRAVEDIARLPADKVLNRAGLLTIAQSHAQSAVAFLVEVLRRARPNGRLTPP